MVIWETKFIILKIKTRSIFQKCIHARQVFFFVSKSKFCHYSQYRLHQTKYCTFYSFSSRAILPQNEMNKINYCSKLRKNWQKNHIVGLNHSFDSSTDIQFLQINNFGKSRTLQSILKNIIKYIYEQTNLEWFKFYNAVSRFCDIFSIFFYSPFEVWIYPS